MTEVVGRDLETPKERRRPRTLLKPAVRVFAIACALFLTVTVLDSPTTWAADPDTDLDGLTDAYEKATLYTQRVTGSGLPKPIIDAGTETATTTLLPWQGIVNGSFADFTVDHPAKSELTVQVGYWDGTAWVDRYVWDPGSRLVGVSIAQPVANQVLEGTVTVKASVPAADTIDHVDFYLGTALLGTVTSPSGPNTFSISFPALSYPFAGYQLKAVATDKLGAAPSATIPVSIGDTANPSVSFTTPVAGSYVGGTYKVKVRATDGNGITSARLRIDAGAYFPITANFDGVYYWYNWGTTSVADGSHSLTAEATDGVGKVSTATVSVTVDNTNPPPPPPPPCRNPCPTSPIPKAEATGSAFGTASLGATSIFTISGYTQTGTVSTVVADLTKPRTQVVQVDRDNRILPPEFSPSLFHSQLTWRIVVRDWVAMPPPPPPPSPGCPPICPTGIRPSSGQASSILAATEAMSTMSVTQGRMTAFALRIEERTDHTKADTDGDTLTDGAEVKTHFTLPTTTDSDGDAARDDFEVVARTITYSVNGVARSVTVKTNPTIADTDGDGLSDGEEYNLGVDNMVTNPVIADTDGDSLTDGAEVLVHWSNPTMTDTDGDTIADNLEVMARPLTLTVNGLVQSRSVKTFPYAKDSDGDGLRDDSEWSGANSNGVKTDPSDADTDDDGLGDNEVWTVMTIRGLTQLETVLTAIENRQPVRYYDSLIKGYVSLYTEYTVIASPLSRDTDADGLSDLAESFLHSDPRMTDTDLDRILDGRDDDPTIVEIERPMIWVDSITGPEFFPDIFTLKRYWVTYSVQDAAGISEVWVYKDGNYASPIHYHFVGGTSTAQFRDNLDIGWLDAFDGARFEILTKDMNGNGDYLTLKQPTIFDAVGTFLTSATVMGLGPQRGGMLSGGWYAFRDTVVDLATLFLNPQSIFDGGSAVANAFTTQGITALLGLGKALYEFIDETQKAANPYAAGTADQATFRYSWYAGYIAATIGLSVLGAAAAKAVVQGIKATTVFAKISSILGDLSSVAKVTQYINRLKGIGIVNSRILIGAVFTTAFAAAAYAWPEIFGAWFERYLGGAFLFMSVYNLGPGPSPKALKGIARGIGDGVIDGTLPMERRLSTLIDSVLYEPLDATAGPNRLRRMLERLGKSYDLPNGAKILDTVVLLEGDGTWGWQHIRARHILGTDTSGAGRLTRFPADLDEPTIQRIIAETVTNGKLDPSDALAIVHNLQGKYGINNVRVVLNGDGRIWTAYPVDGPKVIVVRSG